jgi:molecular chaperone DnaK
MAAKGVIIGIDLGTTNSCMAAILQGELVVIPNAEGGRTTPSVVAYAQDKAIVGVAAKQQSAANPYATLYSIKRFIGRKFDDPTVVKDRGLVPFETLPAPNKDVRFKVLGKELAPPEISAQVLAKMKADAEAFVGEPITQAVITVPAYFNDSQRQATKDAGRIAGLEVLRIVNEPTAASLSCGLDKKKSLKIAVFDLGGGTFDVSILELGKGLFEVRATNGDTHLGGDDFDQALIYHLLREAQKNEGLDLSGDKLALLRLKEAAEKAKIELSSLVETRVELPFIAKDANGPRHLSMALTRETLEKLCKPLVEATLIPCEAALRDAGLTKDKIDEVLLVGGMTRMPAVAEAVSRFFGKAPHPGVDPDEAVALGAAIQAGVLKGEVRDTLLLDVIPMSLGVRTEGGLFSKVVEKNTTIPARITQLYTTANDNQTSVRISVFQGEQPLAAQNMFLGDFELVNLKAAARGTPQIEVTFDVDANGILKVSAKDKQTGRIQQIRIEPNTGLSVEELDRMVHEAEERTQKDKNRNELDQLRKTLGLLLGQAKRDVQDSTALPEDKKRELWHAIGTYAGEAENSADATHLKDMMKELNTFLLGVRMMSKPQAAPAVAKPETGSEDAN